MAQPLAAFGGEQTVAQERISIRVPKLLRRSAARSVSSSSISAGPNATWAERSEPDRDEVTIGAPRHIDPVRSAPYSRIVPPSRSPSGHDPCTAAHR